MTEFLATLIGIAGLAFVFVPLLRRHEEAAPEREADRPRDRLTAQKAVAYENIRDLDFEYAMGKLSDEDYRSIREDLMTEAESVLRSLDAVGRDAALERWIESEIALRRQRGQAASAGSAAVVCGACRHHNPDSARFCDECGVTLGAAACPKCGTAVRPGAKFCGQCGERA